MKLNKEDLDKINCDVFFLVEQVDLSNFGFYIHANGEVELVLLDNEYFLQNFRTATRPMACGDDEIDSQDFMHTSKRYEATKFFESMSDEMRELVPKYLEMFSPQRVEVLLNNVEEEQCLGWPLKASSLRQYRRNYNMICKLLGMKKGYSFKISK